MSCSSGRHGTSDPEYTVIDNRTQQSQPYRVRTATSLWRAHGSSSVREGMERDDALHIGGPISAGAATFLPAISYEVVLELCA
jgi:hypothetical protein